MKGLSPKMLSWYNSKELKKLSTMLTNYIVPVDKENIKWSIMKPMEMKEFFEKNYGNDKVYWLDYYEKTPLGMTFLPFPPYSRSLKFFVGTIKNNLNLETIVGCIGFRDDCEICEDYELVTSIETVEINYFYQGMGLLNLMLSKFSEVINKDQNIIMTRESPMGKDCDILKHLKNNLTASGFNKDVRLEDDIDSEYLNKISRKK